MSAAVLQFPATVQRQARQRNERAALEARHCWMMSNRGKWENEEIDGAEHDPERSDPVYRMVRAAIRERFGMDPEPTIAEMRRDISEGRKLIEKRNSVKRWLASLGVDLAEVKNPEQALFAAFDKLA